MSFNENQVDNQFTPVLWENAEEFKSAFSSCLIRVFVRMFAALLVTALAAFAVYYSVFLQELIYSNTYVFYGMLIAEFGLVLAISAGIKKMPVATANALFFLYAIVNGLTLSFLFFVYDIGVIYDAFFISALMFVVMAAYGILTRRDLSSIGSICTMGLLGIILAGLFNFFIYSDILANVVSYVGVVVFTGLTVYDVQRIKNMLTEATESNQAEAIRKISVVGALTLYLDFINLFLKILRIMGKKRR